MRKKSCIRGCWEDIAIVGVQSGWPHLFLGQLPMCLLEVGNVHHSWTYASGRSPRQFWLSENVIGWILDLYTSSCLPFFVFLVEAFYLLFTYPFIPIFIISLQDIGKYSSFSMLPRDITQLIFNELVYSQHLSKACLEAFKDCAIQVTLLRYIPIDFMLGSMYLLDWTSG